MAHRLIRMIRVTRLDGHLSDQDDSDHEAEEGRSTVSDLPPRTARRSASAKVDHSLEEQRRQLRTPMPSADFLDQVLLLIDADVVSEWLKQATSEVKQLNQLWKDRQFVYDLSEWWLDEIGADARKELIDAKASVIKRELSDALHVGLKNKTVTEKQLHSLMRAVLREYPRQIPNGKNAHTRLFRYLSLLAFVQLTPKQVEAHAEMMSNVRCNSRTQQHIHWLLAARAFALVSICYRIVEKFCIDRDIDVFEKLQTLKNSPVTPTDKKWSNWLIFNAVDRECVPVLNFLLGVDPDENDSSDAAQRESRFRCFSAMSMQQRSAAARADGDDQQPGQEVCAVSHWVRDETGERTLPGYAVYRKKHAMLKYLLKVFPLSMFNMPGAPNGSTPLHCAVGRHDVVAMSILIEHGVDVNKYNGFNRGATPLHVAVLGRYLDAAAMLLQAGANVNAVMGVPATDTPLTLAINVEKTFGVEENLSEICKLLKQYGAKA